MFNLQSVIRGQNKAGYVRTYVHSDEEQKVRIDFGTDEGNKLWLNDKLVHADAKSNGIKPGEHKAPATLLKGWNTVLLKATQSSGPWNFCLAIRQPNGEKLEGLIINPSEPVK